MRRSTATLWLGPALLLIAATAVFPIVVTFWMSLHRRFPIFGVNEYVGLANYVHLAQNPRFLRSAAVTLSFTLVSVAVEFALGLACALALRRDFRGHRWILAVLLIPWIVPTTVSARIWEWIYNGNFGLLNYLLLRLGVIAEPVVWTADVRLVLPAAMLAEIWKTTPFMTLLLLAGLKSIPQPLYRAAAVDGAGAWTTFLHVTWPQLKPMALVALLFRSLDSIRVFDVVYVLTGGGPAGSTETLSVFAYKKLFQSLEFGYGSAVGIAVLLLSAAVSALFLLCMGRLRPSSA